MQKKRSSKPQKELKKSILIYCDGHTEKNYAMSLKQDRYKNRTIKVEPCLESKGFKHVFEYLDTIVRNKEDEFYHCILYVLDMDTIYSKRQIDIYVKEKARITKKFKADSLFIIESRPCIEFWFILHFSPNDKVLSSYDEAKAILQKHVPGYEKTNKFTQTIYDRLVSKLETAMLNARSNEARHKSDTHQVDYSYSLMHILIETLDDLLLKDHSPQ